MGRRISMLFVVAAAALAADACGSKKKDEQPALPAAAAGEVGKVLAVAAAGGGERGRVTLKGRGEGAPAEARPGAALREGDAVSTGEGANAMLEVGARQVALNGGTELQASSKEKVVLRAGEIWVRSAPGRGPGGFAVETASGKVAFEGTIAVVGFRDRVMRVSLLSGSAKVTGEKGELPMLGGQEAVVDARGIASLAPIADPGALVAWTSLLRREIGERAAAGAAGAGAHLAGLGTLTARAPGGKSDLPFDMVRQGVRVAIVDRVALTEVEQVFRNPTKATVEGTFRFPIPQGARMTRYAMEIKGRLMEGEIVERQKGRSIMRSVIAAYLDRMRDPALVEWESGSTFSTKIFPILPGEQKRVVLSYVEVLEGAGGKYRYVLPLAAPGELPPPVPDLRIEAEARGGAGGAAPLLRTPLYPAEVTAAGGASRAAFAAKDFSPVADFVVEVDAGGGGGARLATFDGKAFASQKQKQKGGGKGDAAAAAGDAQWSYFLMTLAPPAEGGASQVFEGSDFVFLVDTSQSRTALDMELEKRVVQSVVEGMSAADRLKLIAFDVAPRAMGGGWESAAPGLTERVGAFLDALPPAGATNVEAALRAAAAAVGGDRHVKIVLVGDGAATLGESRPGELVKTAQGLLAQSGSTVSTIGVGGSVDSLLLTELASGAGGKHFRVSAGEDLLAAAVRIVTSLKAPVIEAPTLSIEGIAVKDVEPRRLPPLSAGEEIVVTGRFAGTGEARAVLRGRLGGAPYEKSFSFAVGAPGTVNGFVPVVWAARRIDALTLEGGAGARKEIVRLSKRFSLPSRYTSFIVLESEEMYREFGVERVKDRVGWDAAQGVEFEEAKGEAPGAPVGGLALDDDASQGDDLSAALDSVAGAGEMKVAASGMSKADPAAPAKGKKAAERSSQPMYYDDPFLGGGGGSGMYGHYHAPVPVRAVTIRELPPPIDAAALAAKKAALAAAVEKDPLDRGARRKQVRQLMGAGLVAEAFEAAKAWYVLDGSNAAAVQAMGDLVRLKGDAWGGARYLSGVLDVSPENGAAMEKLAGWFEGRGRWGDAYPFRVSLSLLRPKDAGASAARVLAAARAGLWEDAARAAQALCATDKGGKARLKAGAGLSPATRGLVERIAGGERPVGLLDAGGGCGGGGGKLTVELQWQQPVDLDLWVLSPKGEVLGGGGAKGRIVEGKSGGQGEAFCMSAPKDGSYRVQVFCGDAKGCGTLAGKVTVGALGKEKTIPFVMESGWGSEVAQVRIATEYSYKY